MVVNALFFKMLLLGALLCATEKGFSQVKYQVYADYVYLFAKNTVYPHDKEQGDFVIGVIGKENLYSAIQNIAFTKKLNGRNILVKQFSDIHHAQNCHILFIDSNQNQDFDLAYAFSQKTHTLLVSENVSTDKSWSTINFVNNENGINFELDSGVAKQQQLSINNDLLRLAIAKK